MANVEKDINTEYKVHVVKSLGDINLKLDESVFKFMLSNNFKIDIRGPVFVTFKSEEIS